jgi:hypothetical protein
MMFCVCKVIKKHKTAKIIKQTKGKITNSMFFETVDSVKGGVILYKAVNPETFCDFQTGKIKYEGEVTCPDFDPDKNRECGGGLHLSPTPEMALSYHVGKVLKCLVKKEDIVIYHDGNYTKVRCRKVKVLSEVK